MTRNTGLQIARRLAVLAALAPFSGCAVGAETTAECSAPSDAREIALTPRADGNVELLALKFSSGIVASRRVYDRLSRDIKAIRTAYPALRAIDYLPTHDGQTLSIEFDAASLRMVRAQQYHPWDCLNSTYSVSSINTEDDGWARIRFKGRYNLDKLARLYARLPGVRIAEPNRTTSIESVPKLCVSKSNNRMHYVFETYSEQCVSRCDGRTLHYFTSVDEQAPTLVARWAKPEAAGVEDRPGWVKTFWNAEACR